MRKQTSTILRHAAMAFAVIATASPLFAEVITTGDLNGADAYILGPNNGQQNNNFGGAVNVIAQDFSENSNFMSHLRFDVSGLSLGSFTSATLRLTSDNNLRAGELFQIHGLNDSENADGWGEATITYNNAPGVTVVPTGLGSGDIDPAKTTFLGTATHAAAGGKVNFSGANLLPFLQSDTDGQVTFIVSDDGSSHGAALIWAAKEHPTRAAPTLVFATGDSAPQGAGLISIDFNDLASPNIQIGDVNGSNGVNADGQIFLGQAGPWNSLGFENTGTGATTNSELSTAILLDGNGTPTTVGFTYNTGGDTYRAIEFPTDGSGHPLRTDHVFLNDTTAGIPATSDSIDWEITGLEPGGEYDLIFFGQDGPANESQFTVFGEALSNDTEFDGNAMGIIADASGMIFGTHELISAFSSWDGLQIRQRAESPGDPGEPGDPTVPEPASIALWGMLGLVAAGFGMWRRRRR